MKIEIFYEPMTPENIDEATEALAIIIVQYLTENYLPLNREPKKENKTTKTKNN